MRPATQSTYYTTEVHRLRQLVYPGDNVCARIIAAKRFIERHYAEALDMRTLSQRACVSHFHFIRLFRRLYGRSPYQFLIGVRMQRARELLRLGASVEQASVAVGYESVASFSALFKRMNGASPSSWAKKSAIFDKPQGRDFFRMSGSSTTRKGIP